MGDDKKDVSGAYHKLKYSKNLKLKPLGTYVCDYAHIIIEHANNIIEYAQTYALKDFSSI